MRQPLINRAAIYVKATAGNSREGAERSTQMDEAEQFCKERGLHVTARYSDDQGVREEFRKMMGDATGQNPPFDHVVVWRLRYFAWDLDESIQARNQLAANGIRLLSVKEQLPER